MTDDESPLSSRTSSIESMDFETTHQINQNRQISQVLQSDSENQLFSEICESLSLDKTENESHIIARQLLINGRQELVHHRDNIAPIDFDNQMDTEGNSTLLKIIKRYFQQQWQQIPFDWFNTFITKQQSQDNDKHYQQVLTRTAEYGQKYMKECPVFSIVLQLIFVFDDDNNIDETIFDQVWNTFAMDGCTIALKKWKKYIVPAVMKEHIDSHNSPLFLALREYFREPVLLLFSQSKILDQRNLLEITLDCLANDGWVAGLNDDKVKKLIAKTKHDLLMTNLIQYLKENGLPIGVDNFGQTSSEGCILTTSTHQSPYPTKNLDRPFTFKRRRNSRSSSSSLSEAEESDDPVVAYIPDLPLQIDDNQKLDNTIRQCLKHKYKQDVIDIKCNTSLGIARVYLRNNNEKDYLINVLKSTTLDSEGKDDIIIKFVSNLQLVSYVVIELRNDKNLPTPNEVAQRWVDFYKSSRPLSCELLSIQFPNIFRIVSKSLDEFEKLMTRKEFSIAGQNATVYFRADCCFLEELPRNTSTHQLRHAITDQISQENISTESFYIQYNETAANAVILTCGTARKWALFNYINLGERVIMKKTSITSRLLVRPSQIQNHKIFENAVDQVLFKDNCRIVDLSDKAVYEQCVNQDALHVEICDTFPINAKEREINAENWYETEMRNHKPNIMPFISHPKHPIFRWKWNPQAFQEQFRRCSMIDRRDGKRERDHRETDGNQKRQLLRVTVMLNTIGTVWKGNYRVAEREIKIKEDVLKTIVYDHRSRLQRGATMSLLDVNKVPYTSTLIKVVHEDCLYVYQQLVAQKCRPVLLNMANANSPGGGYRKGAGAQEEILFRRSNYFRSLDSDLDDGKSTSRFYCNSNCELEILSERQRMYPMDEFGAIYTSGLTVFRQTEDTGYAFMDESLSNVCAIAMAAYRDPKVENDRLTRKYSIGMRKKIENIFAIANHYKHDCLVLSALGCGAFKNPPKHIAAIFESVAKQYAGFFKSIYFAIIDDHNTGLQFNPKGNYHPFKQILDGTELKPTEHKMKDVMIGPWRILNMLNLEQVTLSDIRICYLIPCYHGGKCNDLENVQHCREYSHPSLCRSIGSGTTCKLSNDEDHTLWFIHPVRGIEKPLIYVDQPIKLVPCHQPIKLVPCHQPIKLVPCHQPIKLVPCHHSINCLRQEDTNHMKKYSHPCPYSELCRQKNKEPHLTHESHVVSHCSMGKSCNKLDDPIHRAKYRHIDMPDFLIPCRYQQECYRKSYEHRIKFSHGTYIELSPKDVYPKAPSSIPPHERMLNHMQRSEQIPCQDGLQCRKIHDAYHRSRYSHSDKQHHRSKYSYFD